MKENQYKQALQSALRLALDFLDRLDEDPVDVSLSYEELKSLWQWELPTEGMKPEAVVEEVNLSARPGLKLNQSGRFFSWVIGGSHPSAVAVDWLTAVWDQNAGLYAGTPSSSIVEEIAGSWLKQLLHLPEKASFAFVTGCQMANFVCINVARNHLFRQVGWDFETHGFYGAPKMRVICGDAKHNTITRALRMLGFGSEAVVNIPTDEKGTISVDALRQEFVRDSTSPTMVLLQAGEIHTGAFDDFKSIIPIAHQHNAWVHIDGAFGLWANANPKYAHYLEGAEDADSWATDGHKWLNVPYDSGFAFTAHPSSHFQAMTNNADYLSYNEQARDQYNWNPELSRRARGFTTYATIKELGVRGIADLVDRCCVHASAIVEGIGALPNALILSHPIINQGLLRFVHPNTPEDELSNDIFTLAVIEAINKTGEALFQPSTFKGRKCMRVSVSGWRTSDDDVHRTIAAARLAIEKVGRQVNEKN